jgi:hypothetical protein
MDDPDRTVFRTAVLGPRNCGKKSLVLSTVISGHSLAPVTTSALSAESVNEKLQYAASSLWRCRVSCSVSEEERDNIIVHGLSYLSADCSQILAPEPYDTVELHKRNVSPSGSPHGKSVFSRKLLATNLRPLNIFTTIPCSLQPRFDQPSLNSQFDTLVCCFSVTHAHETSACDCLILADACAPKGKVITFVQTRADLAGKQSTSSLSALDSPTSKVNALEKNECLTVCVRLLQKRALYGAGPIAGLFSRRVTTSDILSVSATQSSGIADFQHAVSVGILKSFKTSKYRYATVPDYDYWLTVFVAGCH